MKKDWIFRQKYEKNHVKKCEKEYDYEYIILSAAKK